LVNPFFAFVTTSNVYSDSVSVTPSFAKTLAQNLNFLPFENQDELLGFDNVNFINKYYVDFYMDVK
jgi:hypothetical protein